jgi:hypothetical protein
MIDCDYLLSILCDQGDGAVAVPLRNRDTPCLVAAALDGDHIIGTPLLVQQNGNARAATMQEIKDAHLDRGVVNRD